MRCLGGCDSSTKPFIHLYAKRAASTPVCGARDDAGKNVRGQCAVVAARGQFVVRSSSSTASDVIEVIVPATACLISQPNPHVQIWTADVGQNRIGIVVDQPGWTCFLAGDPPVDKPLGFTVGPLPSGSYWSRIGRFVDVAVQACRSATCSVARSPVGGSAVGDRSHSPLGISSELHGRATCARTSRTRAWPRDANRRRENARHIEFATPPTLERRTLTNP